MKIPELNTQNLIITLLKPDDVRLLVNYQNDNKTYLAKWEPVRTDEYYTVQETKKRIESHLESFKLGHSISFVAFNQSKTEIVALCTFSNIVHGVFQACNLGYSISESYQGKGLMCEMLQSAINYVFDEYKLHRIMANYMPENHRSAKLLHKLGFEKEGLAKAYLKIADEWKDHILTSKLSS